MIISTIFRKVLGPQSSVLFGNVCRISTTKLNQFKEIKINENDDKIVVEAVPIESDRKDYLIENVIKSDVTHSKNCKSCPLCRLNLKRLQYSDVLILNQFIESDGHLIPQSVTGLCNNSYRKIKNLVHQAQSARLLPRPPEFEVHGPWSDLNHYYEYPQRKRDRPMNVIRKEYWK